MSATREKLKLPTGCTSHLHLDCERIRIQRIVDYYHDSLRLTTIADALLTSSQRTAKLRRVRKLLLALGVACAIHCQHGATAGCRFCQQERPANSEILPLFSPEIHDLLGVPRQRPPDRQRHCGIWVSANCDRTSEALRDAVISRPRLSDHDSAIHPAQPNLDRNIPSALLARPAISTPSAANPRDNHVPQRDDWITLATRAKARRCRGDRDVWKRSRHPGLLQ